MNITEAIPVFALCGRYFPLGKELLHFLRAHAEGHAGVKKDHENDQQTGRYEQQLSFGGHIACGGG
jgi:hypothetical protein